MISPKPVRDTLIVPEIDADSDAASAALAYASAGWYVLPVRRGSKRPGSVVGDDWPTKSSREADQIVAWFAGTDHGIALHCGRSGAVIVDVDHFENLPDDLSAILDNAPFQSTRHNDSRRGHYVYRTPPGRTIGNSNGKLGTGWGEIRGNNGVIIVEPSVHQNAREGGRYKWIRCGDVPVLPAGVAALLPESKTSECAVSDAETRRFAAQFNDGDRHDLIDVLLADFDADVAEGGSRHQAAIRTCTLAMKNARAQLFPASDALARIHDRFIAAVSRPGRNQRTRFAAESEWSGIVAWAVGQAMTSDPEETQRYVAETVDRDEGLTLTVSDESNVPMTQVRAKFSAAVESQRDSNHPSVQSLLRHKLPPPSKPAEVAREIRHEFFEIDGTPNLVYWCADWWIRNEHTGRWKPLDAMRLLRAIERITVESYYKAKDDNGKVVEKPWNPKNSSLREVADSLARQLHHSIELRAPFFVNHDDGKRGTTRGLIVFRNGVLDVTTGAFTPPNAALFTTCAVDADYDPSAPEPTAWLAFLDDIFGGDTKTIALLQEWFGYVLSGDRSAQKMLLLVGPPRSGKGTIMHILFRLLGKPDGWVKQISAIANNTHDTASLVDAPLVVFPDVRMESRKSAKIVETLLSLSGGDPVEINRKYKDAYTMVLPARFMLLSNELPRFRDASGALASRFVAARMVKSFLGREDTGLLDKLSAELDGITNWAVAGYARYLAQGRFTENRQTKEIENDLVTLGNPTVGFIRSELHFGEKAKVRTEDLLAAYNKWCAQHGHEHAASVTTLIQDMQSSGYGNNIRKVRKMVNGSRDFYVLGVRLKTPSEKAEDDGDDVGGLDDFDDDGGTGRAPF